LAAELDVLDDLDQDFLSALFERSSVAQVVFHFGAGGDHSSRSADVFSFLDRESGVTAPMIGTSARTIQRMMPFASFRIPSIPGIRSAKLRSSPKNSRAFSRVVRNSS
jgi:hypothetical protein